MSFRAPADSANAPLLVQSSSSLLRQPGGFETLGVAHEIAGAGDLAPAKCEQLSELAE